MLLAVNTPPRPENPARAPSGSMSRGTRTGPSDLEEGARSSPEPPRRCSSGSSKRSVRRQHSRSSSSSSEAREAPRRRRIPLLAVFAGLVIMFTVFVVMQTHLLPQHPQTLVARGGGVGSNASSGSRAAAASHASVPEPDDEGEAEGEEPADARAAALGVAAGGAVPNASAAVSSMPAAAAASVAATPLDAAAATPAAVTPAEATQLAATLPAATAPLPALLRPVLTDAAQCGEAPQDPSLDVTLVMHASADRLWMLPEICDRWGGPMVAVQGQVADEISRHGAPVGGWVPRAREMPWGCRQGRVGHPRRGSSRTRHCSHAGLRRAGP